jgi:hypothetical protein
VNWHGISVTIGICVLFGGAMLFISGLPSMRAEQKGQSRPIDSRRQRWGFAAILGGLVLIVIGVNSSIAALVELFNFSFLFWGAWRMSQLPAAKLSQSLELAVIVALWLLTLAVQFATEVNTDVSIDQWSGRDWWNGGALLLAVFCTGAAYQHVNQLWHRRKSAPQPA